MWLSTIATIASVLLHFFPTSSTGILLESQWGCPQVFCRQTTGKKQRALLVPRLMVTVDEWRSTLSAATCSALVLCSHLGSALSLSGHLSLGWPCSTAKPLAGILAWGTEHHLRGSCVESSHQKVFGEKIKATYIIFLDEMRKCSQFVHLSVYLSLMAEHRGTTAA